MCACSCFSHARLSATPWTVARQAPLSMGFSTSILEGVVMPSSRGSSRPRNQTYISCVSCILYLRATGEAPKQRRGITKRKRPFCPHGPMLRTREMMSRACCTPEGNPPNTHGEFRPPAGPATQQLLEPPCSRTPKHLRMRCPGRRSLSHLTFWAGSLSGGAFLATAGC